MTNTNHQDVNTTKLEKNKAVINKEAGEKMDQKQTKSTAETNGTAVLNGVASEEDFYLINGHRVPKRGYMRVRQKGIVAAQQLSVDLAHNSHTFLRYGTYAILVFAFLLVFPHYFTIILRPNLPPVMDGYAAPGFEKVAETFKYVKVSPFLYLNSSFCNYGYMFNQRLQYRCGSSIKGLFKYLDKQTSKGNIRKKHCINSNDNPPKYRSQYIIILA